MALVSLFGYLVTMIFWAWVGSAGLVALAFAWNCTEWRGRLAMTAIGLPSAFMGGFMFCLLLYHGWR